MQQPKGDSTHDRLVTLASFSTPMEAGLARSRLAAEGIDAFLDNENLVAANWLLSGATGGVKLQVRASQIAHAQEVLQKRHELAEEDRDEDDGYTDEPWRCPSCHHRSLDLVPFSPGAIVFSLLLLGLPLLFIDRTKVCRECGHQWR